MSSLRLLASEYKIDPSRAVYQAVGQRVLDGFDAVTVRSLRVVRVAQL